MALTYTEIAKHYDLDVCDMEDGCILSPSSHKRGDATRWRSDVVHWYMNRRVTAPGMIRFMLAVGKIKAPPIETYTNGITPPTDRHVGWALKYATPNACMWAQLELKNVWKITISRDAFSRQKHWTKWYLDQSRSYGVKPPRELMATPMAMWAHSTEAM